MHGYPKKDPESESLEEFLLKILKSYEMYEFVAVHYKLMWHPFRRKAKSTKN